MAPTKVKRRYTNQKSLEFKLYGDTLDKCMMESDILNRQPLSISTIFWDKNNLITEIELFETEVIPARQAALIAANNAFANYNEARRREGRTVDDEVWPEHLLSRRCKAEARYDCALRELEALKERLEKYYTKVEAELENVCLEYGPRGNGRLRDGRLAEIDGQRVEYMKIEEDGSTDEILVIVQNNSPFKGMSCSDYRKFVVAPWTKQRSMHMYNQEKQRQKELAETGFSKIIVRSNNRKVHPSSIPAWPEGVKNYYQVEEIHEAVEDETETSTLVQ
jgi:hypothetical protein